MHEASLHTRNSFITLTYAPEHLPKNGTLVKEDFKLFMKRFRKKIAPEKVRYYMCGEYGEKNGRPHYHAILFGYQFPDLEKLKQKGDTIYYTSVMLAKLWGKGHVVIGNVTFDSAAYVARYCMKKITGKKAEEINPETGLRHYERLNDEGEIVEIEPEYANQSRRPGIAMEWFKKYGGDLYPKDYVTFKGQKFKPPSYYDTKMEEIDEALMESIKKDRVKEAKKRAKEITPAQQQASEKIIQSKLSIKRRVL